VLLEIVKPQKESYHPGVWGRCIFSFWWYRERPWLGILTNVPDFMSQIIVEAEAVPVLTHLQVVHADVHVTLLLPGDVCRVENLVVSEQADWVGSVFLIVQY